MNESRVLREGGVNFQWTDNVEEENLALVSITDVHYELGKI